VLGLVECLEMLSLEMLGLVECLEMLSLVEWEKTYLLWSSWSVRLLIH